jgi:tetratricopeptide (TPR) repeat protein
MNKALVFLLAVIVFSACSQQNDEEGTAQQMSPAAAASDAPQRDISNEALMSIDPAIQEYTDRIETERKAYEEQPDEEGKAELVSAYLAFADYMTYESPVSPREGKYHRALIEYRHALELDPDNSKAIAEIQQIEDIYRSMNRPVPGEE